MSFLVGMLASSALWVAWMALFGACLIGVWLAARHIPALAKEYEEAEPAVPPARERHARIVEPPAPPQPPTPKPEARRLSEYEIEEKLKAADRVLALLKDVRDTATLVRETHNVALLHFAHRESAQTQVNDLGRRRGETTALYDKIRAFCDEIHQYPDLAQSVQPLLGTIHNVTAAIEHFRTAYNNLTQVMRFPTGTADSGVFGFQIQPFLSELAGRLNYLEDQRNKTRDAVLTIRKETGK
jgi:hypothetical protein